MSRAGFALLATAIVELAAGSDSLAHLSVTEFVREAPRFVSLPTNRPEFHPGPHSLSGRVVRLIPGGAVVDSAGRENEVSFVRVVDVWKETSVSPSAIEVGDDLFINGTGGAPFVATYISANIGRIDGVIREIDATGMLLDVHLRAGGSMLQRVDFSPYIEYGAAGVTLSRSDLVVGRMIGAVIYRERGRPLRATRIW